MRFKERCYQRQAPKGRARSKILILLYFSIREIFTQKLTSYNKILLILVFCLSNANEYIYMMVMMMLLYVQKTEESGNNIGMSCSSISIFI